MTHKINKILQFGLYFILALSVVFFGLFYINGESMADLVMYWTYILLAITVILLLVFPIKSFITNPKKGFRFLIAVVGFIIIYGISYALASGETNATIYEVQNISTSVSRLIGAGMIMTFIIGGFALLGLIISGLLKAFK